MGEYHGDEPEIEFYLQEIREVKYEIESDNYEEYFDE